MSRLSAFFRSLIYALFCALSVKTSAAPLTRYECLRELLPISDRGAFQSKRKGFDSPLMIADKYIVFPEVAAAKVTGFFIYDAKQAWYYDAVELNGTMPIAALVPDTNLGLLQLTAQPNGLETVTVPYLPDYNAHSSGREGAAVLGSSVLPVVGAFVSRPKALRRTYQDPSKSTESELKAWVTEHSQGRLPASHSDDLELKKTLLKMVQRQPKSPKELWQPLNLELRIRRDWIQSHNLDENGFKQVRRALDPGCSQ